AVSSVDGAASTAASPEEGEPSEDRRSPAASVAAAANATPFTGDRRRAGSVEQLSMELGPTVGSWSLPPPRLLSASQAQKVDRRQIETAGRMLEDALAAHGVATRLVGMTVGPTVTRYELELGAGVKVARVTSLSKDIAYAMASPDVRILAPIPGRAAMRVELGHYNGLPHLLTQVVVNPKRAANALMWAVHEMERRYDILAEAGMRDIGGYNRAVDAGELVAEPAPGDGEERPVNRLPYI